MGNSGSSGSSTIKRATCSDCKTSVDDIEWRHDLFEDRQNPEKTICIFGQDTSQTETMAISSNFGITAGQPTNTIGMTKTVESGKPMGKMFAMLPEAEHVCNENCNKVTRTVRSARYDGNPLVGGFGNYVTVEVCLTKESEEAKGLPRQYRCAACFLEKHAEAFKDMLATVFGRMYIINVSEMKMVHPQWGGISE